MKFEKSLTDPKEVIISSKEGVDNNKRSFFKNSLESMKEDFEDGLKDDKKEHTEEKEKINNTRRTVLKMGVAGGAAIALGALDKKINIKSDSLTTTDDSNHSNLESLSRFFASDNDNKNVSDFEDVKDISVENVAEVEPVFNTLENQFKEFDEIRDIHAGIRAERDRHFYELMNDENEIVRIEKAVELRNKLNLDTERFVKPFVDRGFKPSVLPFLIVAQESDFDKNAKSVSGAQGLFQLRKVAAMDVGHSLDDASDPYKASLMAAKLLDNNRRYGVKDDIGLLLHSYNSGWSLQGYTKETDKDKQTLDGFYDWMATRLNKRRASGEDIKSILKSKDIEVLNYVPQMIAKKDAYEKNGYMDKIKRSLGEENILFG